MSAGNGNQSGQPPRLLGDRYEVIEVIGSGASAITWRGFDRRLERPVAIKILRRGGHQDDPAWLQRFEREARLAASVSDPHVVQVFDVGQEEGWPYLVMQYVEGQDLKGLITDRGPLQVQRATDITLQILDGLESIHQTGILHRDIKPQNVLLDRQGRVRVTDFGIAQGAFDADLTSDGMALGTASYMAPEQARGASLSEATDIYAVGVVLYEMLTGHTPFERSTPMATMLAHIEDEPAPPSTVAPGQGILPRLDGIVLQAMAKEPGQRFRTATAMARAIDGVTAAPAGPAAGATTRLPATSPDGNTTRLAPRPPVPAVNVRPPQRQSPPPPASGPPVSRSNGGRGPLTFLLVIILLAMVAVAAYLGNELINRNAEDGSPTATVEVAPTPTATPEQTSDVIGPPTSEPAPTATSEPLPTPTPEPTVEPTTEPVVATQEPPLIEPAETSPATEEPIIEPSS